MLSQRVARDFLDVLGSDADRLATIHTDDGIMRTFHVGNPLDMCMTVYGNMSEEVRVYVSVNAIDETKYPALIAKNTIDYMSGCRSRLKTMTDVLYDSALMGLKKKRKVVISTAIVLDDLNLSPIVTVGRGPMRYSVVESYDLRRLSRYGASVERLGMIPVPGTKDTKIIE